MIKLPKCYNFQHNVLESFNIQWTEEKIDSCVVFACILFSRDKDKATNVIYVYHKSRILNRHSVVLRDRATVGVNRIHRNGR